MTLARSSSFFKPGNAIFPLGTTAFGSLQICCEIGVVPRRGRLRRLPSYWPNIWTNSFPACRLCGRKRRPAWDRSCPCRPWRHGRPCIWRTLFSLRLHRLRLCRKSAKEAGGHKRQAEHLRELHSSFLRKNGRGARPASLRTEIGSRKLASPDQKRAAGLPLPHTSLLLPIPPQVCAAPSQGASIPL